jgi:EAL domain-containing protein (putative c-di-GMP-specific phosphodiesterase class I)/CheY-like chemotaxis protein
MQSIGAWVANQACHDIRDALDQGFVVPPIALRFSCNQFQDDQVIVHLQKVLEKYRLTPFNLCIEIKEGALIRDEKESKSILQSLKNLGFSVFLDDFGTGYSSLSYLKTFSFDKVKIDREFIKDLNIDDQNSAIVSAVVGMAHSLGLQVVAVGVETEDQCTILRNNMVDEIQGYLFSKPCSWEDALVLLDKKHQLPQHLLRFAEHPKSLLLVDDEVNIVSSLKRLFRREGYEIYTAYSGQEGLDILQNKQIDVIISDQRMPNMTGVEFLRLVKQTYPETIRIVLSGYTELTSVTDAINEGAVFRFLTKPWEDEKLLEYINKAFSYKRLADNNRQLALKVQTSNHELATANRRLSDFIEYKQQQTSLSVLNQDVVLDVLLYMPIAMIGINEKSQIAFINNRANEILDDENLMIGSQLSNIWPELIQLIESIPESEEKQLEVNGKKLIIYWKKMEKEGLSLNKIITMKELKT